MVEFNEVYLYNQYTYCKFEFDACVILYFFIFLCNVSEYTLSFRVSHDWLFVICLSDVVRGSFAKSAGEQHNMEFIFCPYSVVHGD